MRGVRRLGALFVCVANFVEQTARVRQELDAVRAARRGDEVDGSKLERGPIVLDKPDDGDEKTIDSID